MTSDVQGDSLSVAVSPGQCQQETTTEVDGANNENVYWHSGSAPVGEYKVCVHHFKPCTKEPVKYLVTLYNSRGGQTYEGTLTKDQRRAQLVTSFRCDAPPTPSAAANR